MRIAVTRVFILLFLSTALFNPGLSAYAEQPPVLPQIVQPVDEAKRTVLQGNTHPLARPQFDRGAAPPDLPMNRMLLVLKRSPQQERALLSLLDSQQDKSSSTYHHWLTPETFGQQFGPADQDIQTVKTWLQSHGFQIGRVAKGKNIIEFSGVASQVQEAFHTTIHKYVVNGVEHWANANDPEIPTALTPVVAGVHTLHNFLKMPMIHIAEQKIQGQLVKGKDGKTYVTFSGTPPMHALGPADFATIYNLNPLYKSGFRGSEIALVGRSNIDPADLQDFATVFGQNATANVIINGVDPGDLGGSEEVEATLDATWAAAVATSSVSLVISASTNTTDGVDLSEAYIVDTMEANVSVMSESFGSCEADHTSTEAQGYATLAEQAAAEGMTYIVASGDSGAEGCDDPNLETIATGPVSVNILAATPFNLAVGGTMFDENGQDSKYWNSANQPDTLGSALSYIPENVWNESCTASQCGDLAGTWAGGGGASTFFTKPSWQSGVQGIPNDGWRDVPDVSLTAAGHDPYLLCVERSCLPDSQGFISFFLVSGTSAAAPSFAGIMSLVDARVGHSLGNAGYVLYKLAATEKLSTCNASSTSALPANTCIFNDVTVGNNAVPGEKNYGEPSAQYSSTIGYDLATGLGSVNATNLADKWNTVTFRVAVATLSMSPLTITHGQPVNFTVTVAPQTGTGTPSGEIVLSANLESLGVFSLSGGTVSGTVNSIPGGRPVTFAQYSGDAVFAASPSNLLTFTVTPEPSTTTLSAFTLNSSFNFAPFAGGPYGSFVYLRADVKGQSGFGIPTGFLYIGDTAGSISGNPFTLNSQGNTATRNFLNSPNGGVPSGLFTLVPGMHSIKAGYSGDVSFTPSTSSALNLTITQATTATSLAATGATKGGNLTATVNTTSGGHPPTGTVTFFVNGSAVGSPVALTGIPAFTTSTGTLEGAKATATSNDAALATGTRYSVTATYKGDTNYLSSTAPALPVTLQSDFSFSESENEVDLTAPGSHGALTLTVVSLDGYSGTIDFSASSCSGLPAGATCEFSPTSLAGGGTVQMGITTTAAPASSLRPATRPGLSLFATLSAFGLAGLVWLIVPANGRRASQLLVLLFCVFAITGVGCGGGGGGSTTTTTPPASSAPTPAGSYPVVVTAVSGSLKHNVSFTLVVE
jgi:Pro-kumamolisin, activation domain/Bacterial Ig-like domain (group 3)